MIKWVKLTEVSKFDVNFSFKATCFNFSVLDQKKSNERGPKKKHLRKKNIEPSFGKVNEGDEIKKQGTYFWRS